MNPNEILDTILTFIYIGNGMQFQQNQTAFSLDEIHQRLNREQLMVYLENEDAQILLSDYAELLQSLDKLALDGYLKRLGGVNPTFGLTFEGRWFIRHQGGYVGKSQSLDAERKMVVFVQNETLKNARYLNRLTLILAVGTSIAALYYILEILKNHYPIYSLPFWVALIILLFGIIAGLIIGLLVTELKHKQK